MDVLDFIIFGGETKRYHTWPVLHNQRVDSHSHQVAMICSLMALDAEPLAGNDGGLSVPLLMAALTHDLAEHRVGDLPAPVKRALPDYPNGSFRDVWGGIETDMLTEHGLDWEHLLSEKQTRWLKLADAMEGALYCIRERMMGNRYMDVPFTNFRNYIGELMNKDFDREEPMVMKIVSYIDDSWEQAQ